MDEVIVTIDGGMASFVVNPALDELPSQGQATVRRASHVLPVNGLLRLAFCWLRRRYGERGWVAAFTRLWPCQWEVAIVDGPTLGRFWGRRQAIVAEVAWINKNLL